MLRASIFVATILLAGCPTSRPEGPRTVDDSALRVRIAQAEVKRAAGVAELVELATTGDGHARELALRGLGRSGGPKAMETLEAALTDREPRVVTAAFYAIGVLASLDEDPAWKPGAKIVAALATSDHSVRLAGIEALGRAGDASVQGKLVEGFASRDVGEVEASALALGRHGRRKIPLAAESRAALVAACSHADVRVRYAAVYALSREHEPPVDDAANAALAARITDADPEIRATAIAGLSKRKALAAGRKPVEAALRDRDWRVAVEAVRTLAGPNGDVDGRVLVAKALVQRAADYKKGDVAAAHVIIEALRAFLANPTPIQPLNVDDSLAGGWMRCLAHAAGQPVANAQLADEIARCPLPDHLRMPLLGELFDDKRSDSGFRRAALRLLLATDDPRVRAAGIAALDKTWGDGDDRAQATIIGTIASAIGTKNPIVAGTAIDSATAIYEKMGANHPMQATLDGAVVKRAAAETDVELLASLYTLIGKRAITSGADACRAGLTGPPASAKAAAECLRGLGEAATLPEPPAAQPPPSNVADVIGKKLVWKLATTRGEIVIELRPDSAPWAVATIVALTRNGFYNGLEFHRVVPNFVVQGGDPTQSGWGGPGFTGPAEPASSADGPGFVAGGVGIADAGRDSGGSQWFIMHSRAPHLDGRYTWIGSVISGQKSADALQIGDKVDKATIEPR